MLGPTQSVYRASCNGVMIRLRVNPDSAWITIDRPAHEPFYREFSESKIAAVLARFKAIERDPEKFEAFVNRLLREATGASEIRSKPRLSLQRSHFVDAHARFHAKGSRPACSSKRL